MHHKGAKARPGPYPQVPALRAALTEEAEASSLLRPMDSEAIKYKAKR